MTKSIRPTFKHLRTNSEPRICISIEPEFYEALTKRATEMQLSVEKALVHIVDKTKDNEGGIASRVRCYLLKSNMRQAIKNNRSRVVMKRLKQVMLIIMEDE